MPTAKSIAWTRPTSSKSDELILAVDTTHEFGSLALLRGPEVLEEMLLHSPEGFGQILFGRMAELLARHGCRRRGCRLLRGRLRPGLVHRRAHRAGCDQGTGGGHRQARGGGVEPGGHGHVWLVRRCAP